MLFRNSVAQTLAQSSAYLVSFVLAPIMLDRLGLALFGVWAATGGLAVWVGVLDFGITRALARFVAFEHGRGDDRAIQETVGLGYLVFAPVFVVAVGLSLIAAGPLSHALGHVSASGMRSILLASSVVLGAQMFARVVSSLPFGMSRMIGINIAYAGGRMINLTFSIVALFVSRSLVTYAWANAAAEVLALAITYVVARRTWSKPLAAVPSRERAGTILRFAATSQLSWAGILVNTQTDKIVIAIAIGPSAAGAYEIANRVVSAISSVANLGLSAMLPMLTTRAVREGRAFFASFYEQYTTRTCALAFPIFGAVAATAEPLLRAWLGSVPRNSVLVLATLLGAYLINSTTGVGTSLADAEGDPGLYARPAMWSAIVNILLTVALAPVFGLPGVLAGTAVAIVLSPVLFLMRFQRKHGIAPTVYLRSVAPPLALTAALTIPAAIVSALAYHHSSSRVDALLVAVIVGGLYSLVSWLFAGRLRLLPQRLTLPRWRTSP